MIYQRKITYFVCLLCLSFAAWAMPINLTPLEKQLGSAAVYDPRNDEYEIIIPRPELSVTTAGVKLTSALGLHSALTFRQVGSHIFAEGSIALLESEVKPILYIALDNGLHVTSLHEHYLWDTPSVMFMHFHIEGSTEKVINAISPLFRQLNEAVSSQSTLKSASSSSSLLLSVPFTAKDKSLDKTQSIINPNDTTLDPDQLNGILKMKGVLSQGVYKVTLTHKVPHGISMGHALGVGSSAVFVGSANDAVMIAQISLLEAELQPVLKTLRQANMNITAVHEHILHAYPRIVFIHCDGRGNAADLAETLRKVLMKAQGLRGV
jgi:hypothetical protein